LSRPITHFVTDHTRVYVVADGEMEARGDVNSTVQTLLLFTFIKDDYILRES